ncbi:uncharacterized protein LOC129752937 [Uranotaenia lowii]|uniref:uncharacterized protein LOC129752937 n=1 Tax=Uranotaenia lowii TaxID=190385 RepID=UPI00247A7778|nr:uncharacterized protein LOC129752937 [Uranotaenia lowii]
MANFNNQNNTLTDIERRSGVSVGSRDQLNIYYQNVGGINSCVNEYLLAASCSSYDIVTFTETWLNDRTLTSQVFSSDYTVFRRDRDPHNSTKSTGGGVLIVIRFGLSGTPIDDESWNDQELVWIRIDLESFSRGLSRLCSLTVPEDDILIIGDFNLPGLKWCFSQCGFLFADPARSSFTTPSCLILDSLSSATLRQINSVENENGRLLDLCFVNDGSQLATIELALAPLVKLVSHHPALLLSLEISEVVTPIKKPASFFLDFKNADFVAIPQTLDAIDWNSELESSDPNAAAMKFTHIINYIIDRHVPKRLAASDLRAPWVTKELRQMKALKNKALRYYLRHKSLHAKNQYRKLNASCKKVCTRCYQGYLIRIQRGFKTWPKSFWQYIKDQRKESGLPSYMILEDKSATSDLDICNLFADKFRSTFDSGSMPTDQFTMAASNVPRQSTSFHHIVIDDDTILKATAKLKSSVSAGPDGIPATFLKRYISHMLTPIKRIFQSSLTESTFPSIWKEAYMFPVHKKGDRRNVNNYRDSFAKGSQTDVIYTDLTAAFDKQTGDTEFETP